MIEIMNNTKNKNIIKFSFIYIMLGMSMAERVCGMEEEIGKNLTFTKGMCDALMKTSNGKAFIHVLAGEGITVVKKGGFCGCFCCAKPSEWVVEQDTSKKRAKLFSIFEKTLICSAIQKTNCYNLQLKEENEYSLSEEETDIWKISFAVVLEYLIKSGVSVTKKGNNNKDEWEIGFTSSFVQELKNGGYNFKGNEVLFSF